MYLNVREEWVVLFQSSPGPQERLTTSVVSSQSFQISDIKRLVSSCLIQFYFNNYQSLQPWHPVGCRVDLFFVFFFLLFLWAAPEAYGGSQARGQIGALAAGLRQSHSNAGSAPRLQPTPQLMATPDP